MTRLHRAPRAVCLALLLSFACVASTSQANPLARLLGAVGIGRQASCAQAPAVGLRAFLGNTLRGTRHQAGAILQSCNTTLRSCTAAVTFKLNGIRSALDERLRSALNQAQGRVPDGCFQNYGEVNSFMDKLVGEYPDTVKKIAIGQNDQGATIYGLQIGEGPTKNLVVGTHHGNEYGSTEVATAFAKDIAKSPIDGQTIFVVPVLNTTGFDEHMRWEPNAKGDWCDANRDYPGPCGSQGPFNLKSTKALADFVTNNHIANAASLHTYYPIVAYPWTSSPTKPATPSDKALAAMAKDGATYSGYPTGNAATEIYTCYGTFEDWAYWKNGTHTLCFELGTSHFPLPSQVQEMIKVNVPGLRLMFEKAPNCPAPEHEFGGSCDLNRGKPDPWVEELQQFKREHGPYVPH